ncbi:MAG: chloride channel protein [Candidatus Dormibacteria bacterium]
MKVSQVSDTPSDALGDFTTRRGILKLVPLACTIGIFATAVALILLDLIGLLTNLLYYHRFSFALVSPVNNRLGIGAVALPVLGGLIVGVIARYGSEQVRGHGIPEAMERILFNGSQVEPKLAILKPISSAISIGSGGPFGAEGPIILTGGAVGSIVGQLFRLTGIERRCLLVAGAAAGMSAVFGTPVAATLFGVELLAFEFKPRSIFLIGCASVVADTLRLVLAHFHMIAPQPLFPIPVHVSLGAITVLGAVCIGILGGGAAWVMTQAVYRSEDFFLKLTGRLHWMWWPMIGGIVIGCGGLIDPRALGVGYDTIHLELLGKLGMGALVLLLAVKLVIWAVGLGSGTSGGILAPLLIMGAALGGIVGHVLPGASLGIWALIGMSAALSGVTRSPFTSVIFAFELTHDVGSLLPLLTASLLAYLVSALILKRSILTEKVARRGFHVVREYGVDPFDLTLVQDVMHTAPVLVPEESLRTAWDTVRDGVLGKKWTVLPVVDAEGKVCGVVDVVDLAAQHEREDVIVASIQRHMPALVSETALLRDVAHSLLETHTSEVIVVGVDGLLLGLVTRGDFLEARRHYYAEEFAREQILTLQRIAGMSFGS